MTAWNLCGAVAGVAFTCGVISVGEVYAQRRDGNLLPQNQSGKVTAVGCLMRGSQVKGGDKDNYALSNPRKGPVGSVPVGTCSADAGAPALDLKDGKEGGITDAMLGHVVEVTGELESETSSDPDNLRELDVSAAKLVPVIPPKTEAAPAPAPAPRATPAPERAAPPPPAPAAAEPAPAPKALPRTASNLPAVGLFGVLSLAAAVVLRSFRLRQRR